MICSIHSQNITMSSKQASNLINTFLSHFFNSDQNCLSIMRFFYLNPLPTFQSKIKQLQISWQRSIKPDHYTKFPCSLALVCRKTQRPNPCQLLTLWHYSRTYVYIGTKFPKFTIPQLHSNTLAENTTSLMILPNSGWGNFAEPLEVFTNKLVSVQRVRNLQEGSEYLD